VRTSLNPLFGLTGPTDMNVVVCRTRVEGFQVQGTCLFSIKGGRAPWWLNSDILTDMVLDLVWVLRQGWDPNPEPKSRTHSSLESRGIVGIPRQLCRAKVAHPLFTRFPRHRRDPEVSLQSQSRAPTLHSRPEASSGSRGRSPEAKSRTHSSLDSRGTVGIPR
jgi:hypothetical protein